MASIGQQKILITGVQGQVGYELVKALSILGAELVLAYRNPKDLDGFGYSTVAMDLSSESDIQKVMRSVKPSIVINPAAYTAVDKAESDSETAYQVNQKAVKTIGRELKELNGAMIHFSTDYVYNSDHTSPNFEDGPTNPANVYAASKLAGELELSQLGIPYITLRTSWVYGINGNNFVKTMLKLGREREALNIVRDQVGSPTSAVTIAQTVANILVQGKDHPLEYIRSKAGTYNLSDRGFTSWYEFAQEIFRIAEANSIELKVKTVQGIPTSEYKTPALRPLNSRMDLSKIARDFGIVPPKWQQSLATFLSPTQLKYL